jgi:hypothetical protein
MKKHTANVLLHLARPAAGNEVREILRELSMLAGVERIAPSAKLPRLLMIDYDPEVIAAATLVGHARRRWSAAQLVGM